MGERKVLNKYIPADFDPKLIPRGKKPKDDLVSVRMMLPFTIQCQTCSTFLYRGRKYNSKKENMKGPNGKYLGIQRFRFYIKCSNCSRPITFLTDPENTDYEMESGGTRNYEVWKDKKKTEEDIQKEREDEDKSDAMRALENRVLDSKREMDELDALDEIKAMNMKHAKMSRGGFDVTNILHKTAGLDEEEELNGSGLTQTEEDLVKSIKFGQNSQSQHASSFSGNNNMSVRRLNSEDDLRENERRRERELMFEVQQNELFKSNVGMENRTKNILTGAASNHSTGAPQIILKRKKTTKSSDQSKKLRAVQIGIGKEKKDEKIEGNDCEDSGGALSGLLGGYGSESESD